MCHELQVYKPMSPQKAPNNSFTVTYSVSTALPSSISPDESLISNSCVPHARLHCQTKTMSLLPSSILLKTTSRPCWVDWVLKLSWNVLVGRSPSGHIKLHKKCMSTCISCVRTVTNSTSLFHEFGKQKVEGARKTLSNYLDKVINEANTEVTNLREQNTSTYKVIWSSVFADSNQICRIIYSRWRRRIRRWQQISTNVLRITWERKNCMTGWSTRRWWDRSSMQLTNQSTTLFKLPSWPTVTQTFRMIPRDSHLLLPLSFRLIIPADQTRWAMATAISWAHLRPYQVVELESIGIASQVGSFACTTCFYYIHRWQVLTWLSESTCPNSCFYTSTTYWFWRGRNLWRRNYPRRLSTYQHASATYAPFQFDSPTST